MNNIKVFLARGTVQQHAQLSCPMSDGTLTLVTDSPEFRFHNGDGKQAMIPIPEEIYLEILKFYEQSVYGK